MVKPEVYPTSGKTFGGGARGVPHPFPVRGLLYLAHVCCGDATPKLSDESPFLNFQNVAKRTRTPEHTAHTRAHSAL